MPSRHDLRPVRTPPGVMTKRKIFHDMIQRYEEVMSVHDRGACTIIDACIGPVRISVSRRRVARDGGIHPLNVDMPITSCRTLNKT